MHTSKHSAPCRYYLKVNNMKKQYKNSLVTVTVLLDSEVRVLAKVGNEEPKSYTKRQFIKLLNTLGVA